MAMDSIRIFASGFGLMNLLCLGSSVWKQPVASGERIVIICVHYVVLWYYICMYSYHIKYVAEIASTRYIYIWLIILLAVS